jgi:putative transposase
LTLEPQGRFFLGFHVSWTRNVLRAELFLQGLVDRCGLRTVCADAAYWYPAACRSLGLEHHDHDALCGHVMKPFTKCTKYRIETFDMAS